MRVLTAFVALASLALVACGSPSGPSGSGSLRLMITDAPFDDASAVHVTFSSVEAHADDTDEWLKVPFAGSPTAATTRTCNLKKLQGPQDILGTASFDAGHYTQLRLIVSGATIYFGGDATQEPACSTTLAAPMGFKSSQDMEIPSGEVKLNHPFELASNETTTIELDFDGNRSITLTGNGRYRMTPVIGIKSVKTP